MRRCLLWPSAAVSPGWLKELQPKGVKTKTRKEKTKTILIMEVKALFIISPYLSAGANIYCLGVTEHAHVYNLIIYVAGVVVNENVLKWVRKYVKKVGLSFYTKQRLYC